MLEEKVNNRIINQPLLIKIIHNIKDKKTNIYDGLDNPLPCTRIKLDAIDSFNFEVNSFLSYAIEIGIIQKDSNSPNGYSLGSNIDTNKLYSTGLSDREIALSSVRAIEVAIAQGRVDVIEKVMNLVSELVTDIAAS